MMYKICINQDFLCHFGIAGQKWGKRNGPPYPLDYNKLSAEERNKAKENAIIRGDIQEAQYNRNYFSDAEVRAVISRFQLNQELSKINSANIKTGLDKAKEISDQVGKVTELVDKSIDYWDTFAKISNSLHLTDDPLPIIKAKDDNGKAKTEVEYIKVNGRQVEYTKTVTDRNGNKKTYYSEAYYKDKNKKNNNNNNNNN